MKQKEQDSTYFFSLNLWISALIEWFLLLWISTFELAVKGNILICLFSNFFFHHTCFNNLNHFFPNVKRETFKLTN